MFLAVTALAKSYGAQTVLADASFIVQRGERIGIVGANGSGKTTLLRLLARDETPDGGGITLAPATETGYLPQSPPLRGDAAIAEVLRDAVGDVRRMEERLRELERALERAAPHEATALLDEYGSVATRFEAADGYNLDHRIDAVLAGLGLTHLPQDRAVSSLSGGERARVGLAALLLRSPDLLLLDEPTNHLDAGALDWLESYLMQFPGTVLMVSHDRQFLNQTAGRIFEMDDDTHRLRVYEGHYDAYRSAKAAERTGQIEEYERQQEEIRELRQYMNSTARQVGHHRPPRDSSKLSHNFRGERVQRAVSQNVRAAEERLRRLTENLAPKPPQPLAITPSFAGPRFQGEAALAGRRLVKRYGERTVLREISCTVGPRARIVLMGANGAGKSTLLRLLSGREAPDSGEAWAAGGARIGYLAQQPDLPDSDRSVLEVFRAGQQGHTDDLAADLLRFGLFRYDDLSKPAARLSTGQQRKLELACLIALRPNALLLDEPTNHLSFDVLEGLEAALAGFAGPVIAATHDRWFVQRFGGEVWELRDGALTMSGAAVEQART